MSVNSYLWYDSLNCLNLYVADAFIQFRVLIRILELISIPNLSSDSSNLSKLNIKPSWKECVRFNSYKW